MSLTEYQWKSFDGLDLYALQWSSSEQPEVVVAFVHGHGDHCRRYDEWFSMLTSKNIAVLAFDYRGHGQSQGKRGVIRRFNDLLQDVTLLHEKAKALFPGIPVVLYGHSMGATLVLSYILRSQMLPELAIATSPWLQLNKSPGKFVSVLIKTGNIVAPFFTFKTGLHSSDFSTLDVFPEKREKDEFVHNRISFRFFSEVQKEVQWIQNHFTEIEIPLLLMQGGNDLIMDATATRKLYDRSQGLVNYREWKYAGHQLHNSERSSEVINFIIDWIKKGIC
ncbi:MAG: alpha/beta fold hydrolase [Bacteroidia bacterium]|nr:alpha/beta fold hydrolase [Bacteroidia bacterium]